MKKTRKNQMLKGVLFTLAFTFGIFVWNSENVISFAANAAKVKASSAMIRKDADAKSEIIASVLRDDSLEVISSKEAGDGQTWYKVYVDGEKTGYIRSDLVTVEGTVSAEKKEESASDAGNDTKTSDSESSGNKTVIGSNNSTTTEKKEEIKTEVAVVNVNTTDVATAKATDDVRVRKGAGTKFDVAGVAKKGTEVSVTGISSDSEGKNWYQVSYNDGNKTVNGFIREDLLEVLTRVEEEPVVEEPTQEETVEEEEPITENQDYYLKYMQNDAGEMDWYLFDNVQGTSQSLTQILNVVDQVNDNGLEEAKQVSTMRIIIFALAAVVIICIVVVTVLIFKLRDAYEYEYEDEDEDEDDEEDDDNDTNEEDEGEEEDDDGEEDEDDAPVRKPLFGFMKKKAVVEEEEEEEEEETLKEIQPVQPEKPAKPENKAWQSKDFLELDDDMEFEFLDL